MARRAPAFANCWLTIGAAISWYGSSILSLSLRLRAETWSSSAQDLIARGASTGMRDGQFSVHIFHRQLVAFPGPSIHVGRALLPAQQFFFGMFDRVPTRLDPPFFPWSPFPECLCPTRRAGWARSFRFADFSAGAGCQRMQPGRSCRPDRYWLWRAAAGANRPRSESGIAGRRRVPWGRHPWSAGLPVLGRWRE